MRVIVCGSRHLSIKDRDLVWDRLDKLPRPVTIVHGACPKGADAFARSWVEILAYKRPDLHKQERFPADWKLGRRAGPIRNLEMAQSEPKADLCIAFWDGKSRGTKSMIEEAEREGIPVEIVRAPGGKQEGEGSDGK